MYPRKRVTSIPTPHPYQPGPDHSEPFCHYISAHEPPPPAEPLPPHMRLNGWPSVPFPLNKLCEIIITTCCLLSYGSRNLQGSWDACVEGGERWDAFVDRYAARMSQLNIIAGLIFTGLSTWATTVPPLASLLNYNQRIPYMCLIVAFGGTWGGICVGSAILYATTMVGRTWYRETLMGSRSRVCCTLVLLAYPFFALGISTVFGFFGLLLPCWRSPERLMGVAGTLMLVFPASMLFVFLWTQWPVRRHSRSSRPSSPLTTERIHDFEHQLPSLPCTSSPTGHGRASYPPVTRSNSRVPTTSFAPKVHGGTHSSFTQTVESLPSTSSATKGDSNEMPSADRAHIAVVSGPHIVVQENPTLPTLPEK